MLELSAVDAEPFRRLLIPELPRSSSFIAPVAVHMYTCTFPAAAGVGMGTVGQTLQLARHGV